MTEESNRRSEPNERAKHYALGKVEGRNWAQDDWLNEPGKVDFTSAQLKDAASYQVAVRRWAYRHGDAVDWLAARALGQARGYREVRPPTYMDESLSVYDRVYDALDGRA